MTGRTCLFFWFLICFCVRSSTSDLFLNNGIVSTFSAIQKLLKYFETHYQEVNLDVVFGLRVIEGQCKLLAEDHENGQLEFLSEDVRKQISVLAAEAGKLANKAIPHVHEQDREYFVQMKQLTIEAWKLFHPHRVVNPSLRWTTLPKVIGFSADFSDRCLSDLMVGTKPNPIPCHATEECLQTMFTPGQAGYYLQHQIFYTILAQKMDCENMVNEFLVARTHFQNLEQVQHEFCTNSYYELDDVASHYATNPQYRNLFLEMEFLCPSIGYFQFMKSTWLEDIISWQSADGCFPASPPATSTFISNSNASSEVGAGIASPANLVPQPDLPNIPPPPGFDHEEEEVAHHQRGVASDALVATNYVMLGSSDVAGQNLTALSERRRPFINLGPDSPMREETGGVSHSVVGPRNVGYQIRGYLDNEEVHQDVVRAVPSMYDGQWVQRQSNILGLQPVALGGADQYVRQQPQPFQYHNDVAYAMAPPHANVGFGRLAPPVVPYHHDGGHFGMPRAQLSGRYRMVAAGVHVDARQVAPPVVAGTGIDDKRSDQYRQGRGLKSMEPQPSALLQKDAGSATHSFLFKDKSLSGGCQAHFTSFASAALAMYMRYLVDAGPPEFTHLRLENFRRSGGGIIATPRSSSPYAVVDTNDTRHLRIRTGSDGAQTAFPPSKPNLSDMESRARSFMGTYRRQYDSKFRPVYVGPMGHADVNRGVAGIHADYVHQAEVRKELPDWTVPYVASPAAPAGNESKMGRPRFRVTLPPLTKVVGPRADPSVRYRDVRPVESAPLQRDLDHYLVAVAVITVVFVLVIFRYFRRRRSRLMRLKARHL